MHVKEHGVASTVGIQRGIVSWIYKNDELLLLLLFYNMYTSTCSLVCMYY